MELSMFALEWNTPWFGLLLVFLLFGFILVPFLLKVNRDGKRELGPMQRRTTSNRVVLGPQTPAGAGDNKPGTVVDPAPGIPDGKADPYSPGAHAG